MIAAATAVIFALDVLLAAPGDWVTWVVVAVVVVVSFINQLLSDAAKKKPPQVRRPRGPQPGGGPNPGGGQKSLLDEVERFLQEARNQTAQSHQRPPQQQPQQQPRPQQQAPRQMPLQQKPQQQSKKKQRREQQRREQQQPQRLTASERSRLQPEEPYEETRSGGDLSRLSGQHLQTSRFDERAERLSHLQQQVDGDIGGHVQHAFDHQVGSFAPGSLAAGSASGGATSAGNTTDVSNPALQLIAMLGDPSSMRNAVLMREILEPPTHRW